MISKDQINFVVSETLNMHKDVDDIYESLMDGENKEALQFLDKLGERVRNMKADLSTKEE